MTFAGLTFALETGLALYTCPSCLLTAEVLLLLRGRRRRQADGAVQDSRVRQRRRRAVAHGNLPQLRLAEGAAHVLLCSQQQGLTLGYNNLLHERAETGTSDQYFRMVSSSDCLQV